MNFAKDILVVENGPNLISNFLSEKVGKTTKPLN